MLQLGPIIYKQVKRKPLATVNYCTGEASTDNLQSKQLQDQDLYLILREIIMFDFNVRYQRNR